MSPIDSIAPGLPGTTNRTSGTAPTSGTPVDANVTPDAAVTGGGAGVATRYDSAPVIAKSGATGFLDAVDNGYRQTSAQTHERSIAAIQAKGSAGDGRTASLRDLANLGVFSNADLTELAQAGLSGVELGQLHDMAAQEIVRNYAAESSGAAKVTAPAAGVDAGGAKAPTPEDMAAQSRGASTDRANAVPAPALAGTPQAVAVEQAWDADVRAAFAKAGASDQTTNAMIQDAVTSNFDDAGYQQLYAYLQTPKAATDIATFQAQAATGAVDPATGQPVASAAAARGPSAWSDAWATKFRDVMRAQGASGKVIVTVLQQLKASKPSEQMLTEALTQLSKPTAKAAIKQLNADAKTQSASELRTKFILMGGALVGGAAIMGIKASTGAKNLTNQISPLTHDLPTKSKIPTAA
ncbi:MAG: hypothetical protein H7287_11945, partial [Thermoleophilia bacterium]|nr:hypothetical protein [Thermoleophilia bacterium]